MARAAVPSGRHSADDEPLYYIPERPRAIIGWGAAAVIVLVVVVAAVLIVAAVLSRAPGGQQAGPPAGTNLQSTAASTPTPSQSQTPSLFVPPENSVSGIRDLIQQLVDADQLKADAAHDINRDLNDVAKDVNRGRNDDARQRLADIRDHVNELQNDDEITSIGAISLGGALESFAASLDQNDNGDGGHGNG